nr:hypothetical protein [Apibacter adventoris]
MDKGKIGLVILYYIGDSFFMVGVDCEIYQVLGIVADDFFDDFLEALVLKAAAMRPVFHQDRGRFSLQDDLFDPVFFAGGNACKYTGKQRAAFSPLLEGKGYALA